MKRLIILLLIALAILGAWYMSWKNGMSSHIGLIERSIAEANQRYKTNAYRATIEHGAIHASGFPFKRAVRVEAPSITMIYGKETYAIRLPELYFTLEDELLRSFQLTLPSQATALYAIEGKAPENYSIDISGVPQVWMRVFGVHSKVPPNVTLREVGFQLPPEIMLNATLGDRTEKIAFRQMALPRPIFMKIPADISRPTYLFVGMLREALVFNTPH